MTLSSIIPSLACYPAWGADPATSVLQAESPSPDETKRSKVADRVSTLKSSANRFRGANGSGLYPSLRGLDLLKKENAVRVTLPGSGNGSPVVYDGVIYVQSADSKTAERFVSAIHLSDGRVLWQRAYPSSPHALHKFSSYASSTPCVDENGVYVAWADASHTILTLINHQGAEVWSRDFGPYNSEHGFGTSPVLVDNLVVFLNSQDLNEKEPSKSSNGGKDLLIAVNRGDGNTQWQVEIPSSKVCYGVPCLWKHDARNELIGCTTTEGFFGVDTSSGELLWTHRCFQQRVCSSPLLVGDVVIGTHGSGGGRDNLVVALDLKTKKERFRYQRAAPYVPSPVAKDDIVYLWGDAGVLSALDMSDGKVLWTKRIGGDYSSSPIIAGEELINISVNGTLHRVQTGREFKKLGEFETDLTVRSTPVVAEDHLIVRGEEELLLFKFAP